MVKRRTRRGRIFYGCTRYPECDWSSWDTPVAFDCPQCGAQVALQKTSKRKGDFLRCAVCGHESVPEGAVDSGSD